MNKNCEQFKELIKKVGSGRHTNKDLTRTEAAIAGRMMLLQEATPAQIGAFLIAHRIKRPTANELAGLLDAYDEIGPKLQPISDSQKKVVVLGTAYDGRSRTATVTPITALVLAAAGITVVMHGGDCMPTKYGVPLIELWQGLGVDFTRLSLAAVQQQLEKTGLGFVYLPNHFPEANGLVQYRAEIGKRPPLATLELIWSPYSGNYHQVAGYVHPPTEVFFRETFQLRGFKTYTLVKGLEGSCDLPRDRTAIIVVSQPEMSEGFQYLKLHPYDYGLGGQEVPLESQTELISQIKTVLEGKPCPLMQAAIWNGGFYLWRCGVYDEFSAALAQAEAMLTQGQAREKLRELSSVD